MKRKGNLFETVTSYENLIAAFRLAMRGCGNSPASCRFFYYLEPEILRLQAELNSGTYLPGAYRFFTLYDPKERIIAVAPFRDRVVHQAAVRVITPIYEPVFIYDSYASRPGKGTHAAIIRAQKFMRGWDWYLKTDIEKYFDSVNHDILMSVLRRKLKDRKLLDLLEKIIQNAPVPDKGLPIGNLTSQFLANVYLDIFDHEIKDRMGIKGYVRYMDDFVFFSNSKHELSDIRLKIEDILFQRLALQLKPEATWLNRCTHGLSFLGMRIFRSFIRVKPENRKRSLKRIHKRIKEWEAGYLEEEKMAQSLASIAGHLRYFCPNMPVDLGTDAD